MTTVTGQRVVTAAGVYTDLTDEEYHADPVPGGSLSSTGARKLLPPSCPALFRHWADNPEDRKPHFDFGKAAHRVVLGAGPDIVVVEHDSWRTGAAKATREEAEAAGKVALLRDDYEVVQRMAAALRAHPFAADLFEQAYGSPEASLFAQDPDSGTMLRARLDHLPEWSAGRTIVSDFKTAHAVDPAAVERTIDNNGYDQQADWYLRVARLLGVAGRDAVFLLVFQMKTPPFLVNVVQVDPVALMRGRDRNRDAIDLYATCAASGVWPGYSDGVTGAGLPAYAHNAYLRETQ